MADDMTPERARALLDAACKHAPAGIGEDAARGLAHLLMERDGLREERDLLRDAYAALENPRAHAAAESDELRPRWRNALRALTLIGEAMECEWGDDEDYLVEAVRLLVWERDRLRSELEALRGDRCATGPQAGSMHHWLPPGVCMRCGATR